MKITQEERERQYRQIYELLYSTPRIYLQDISEALKVHPLTVNARLKEAYDQLYILGPDIRKRSYSNLKEYMYFVKCKRPELSYLRYLEDMNVVYHALLIGFCDLWIVSTKKIDIEGHIVAEGYRSDYYVSYAPNRSWQESLEIMKKRTKNFDPKNYEIREYIKNYFNKSTDWSKKDEILYRYFKYNLRRPLTHILKNPAISKDNLYNFLEKLPETCNINTHFYPETLSAYDPYLLMVDTDYEDFIIELFSQLPSSSSFFKVSDKLFSLIYVPKQYMRHVDRSTINMPHIPLLIADLLDKGVIRKRERAIVDYSWAKNL